MDDGGAKIFGTKLQPRWFFLQQTVPRGRYRKDFKMKTAMTVVGAVAIVALAVFGFYMVDIDQTQEARLPNVDVTVEGGQMPAFDAEVGSVQLTEEEVTVKVPDVEVTMEEERITVPGIEVTPPANDG